MGRRLLGTRVPPLEDGKHFYKAELIKLLLTMTIKSAQEIIEKYGLVDEYGRLIDLNKEFSKTIVLVPAAEMVYKAIKEIGDSLTDEEHIILFDTFWEVYHKKTNMDIKISDHLKIEIINHRDKIPPKHLANLVMLFLDGDTINSLVERCGLNSSEEGELWGMFHKRFHGDSARDCDSINRILGIYKIMDRKIKWFGKINVLDVGCGKNGHGISTLVAKYENKIKGFGIDLDIQEHPSNVKLTIATADNLPFPNNSFDVIYSCEVFIYFNDGKAVKALKELLRVLKPKGIFVFSDNLRNSERYASLCVSQIGIPVRVLNYGPNRILMVKK